MYKNILFILNTIVMPKIIFSGSLRINFITLFDQWIKLVGQSSGVGSPKINSIIFFQRESNLIFTGESDKQLTLTSFN